MRAQDPGKTTWRTRARAMDARRALQHVNTTGDRHERSVASDEDIVIHSPGHNWRMGIGLSIVPRIVPRPLTSRHRRHSTSPYSVWGAT